MTMPRQGITASCPNSEAAMKPLLKKCCLLLLCAPLAACGGSSDGERLSWGVNTDAELGEWSRREPALYSWRRTL